MTPNLEKRIKKFDKEISIFRSHPLYETIKYQYIEGFINNISTAFNKLKKVRLNKDGTINKADIKKAEKIESDLGTVFRKAGQPIDPGLLDNKYNLKTNELKQLESKNEIKKKNTSSIILDYNKIVKEKYDKLTNRLELRKVLDKNKNYLYIQDVKYYDEKGANINKILYYKDYNYKNNEVNNDDDFAAYLDQEDNEDKISKLNCRNQCFDLLYLTRGQYNHEIDNINFHMSQDYDYIPKLLVETYNKKAYTKITTSAYEQIDLKNNKYILQEYKDSHTGHCVYDAILEYFNSKSNSHHHKHIYNKLTSEEGKQYKKSYTDLTLHEIASFTNSTIKIRDIVSFKDTDIKTDGARFYIELINTKLNHLDLYIGDTKEYEMKSIEDLETIKTTENFYVEMNGLLYTTTNTYKKKDTPFSITYKEWKKEVKYNELFIYQDSEEMQLITNYDYALHTFFNSNMPVNDDLYDELDIKKAYYNYSNKNLNKFYHGVPSGSFINLKCPSDFNITKFEELTNNNLIGYYEVKIKKINDKHSHFEKLGFKINNVYVLTSCMIELLKTYIDFEFLNVSYAPKTDIKFNESCLNKDESGLKYYVKMFGLMMTTQTTDIKIKPADNDVEYYKTIKNEDYECYKVKDLFYIRDNKKSRQTHTHIAYYIHSYIRTLVIDQLLNMNIDDVFGVKLDSIVVKKSAVFNFNKNLFHEEYKPCNIQNMLTNNIDDLIDYKKHDFDPNNITIKRTSSLLDKGIDDDDDDIDNVLLIVIFLESLSLSNNDDKKIINTNIYAVDYAYFRPLIISKYDEKNKIKFKETFLYSKDIITNRIILLEGPGGSGKTTSLLSALDNRCICYTSSCWNLITAQKNKYKKIMGYSIPKLLLETNIDDNNTGNENIKLLQVLPFNIFEIKEKKSNIHNIPFHKMKYIIIDELTLIDTTYIDQLIKKFPNSFIFLIGDIDDDGFYYQCSLPSINVFNPSLYDCQTVRYTKTYRFDDQLNSRLQELRILMKKLHLNTKYDNNSKLKILSNIVKTNLFKDCIKNIEDVEFNDNDIGISGRNEMKNNNEETRLSQYFIKKGTKEQYYIKNTDLRRGHFKGQQLESKPDHENYEIKLFKTIHSFQGLDLNNDNKIIIHIGSNFDFNLFYTALSRARRVDQIVLLNNIPKEYKQITKQEIKQEIKQELICKHKEDIKQEIKQEIKSKSTTHYIYKNNTKTIKINKKNMYERIAEINSEIIKLDLNNERDKIKYDIYKQEVEELQLKYYNKKKMLI